LYCIVHIVLTLTAVECIGTTRGASLLREEVQLDSKCWSRRCSLCV